MTSSKIYLIILLLTFPSTSTKKPMRSRKATTLGARQPKKIPSCHWLHVPCCCRTTAFTGRDTTIQRPRSTCPLMRCQCRQPRSARHWSAISTTATTCTSGPVCLTRMTWSTPGKPTTCRVMWVVKMFQSVVWATFVTVPISCQGCVCEEAVSPGRVYWICVDEPAC